MYPTELSRIIAGERRDDLIRRARRRRLVRSPMSLRNRASVSSTRPTGPPQPDV